MDALEDFSRRLDHRDQTLPLLFILTVQGQGKVRVPGFYLAQYNDDEVSRSLDTQLRERLQVTSDRVPSEGS